MVTSKAIALFQPGHFEEVLALVQYYCIDKQ